MTTIQPIASSTGGGGVAGAESKIADLQRQCADWRGCSTTPAAEKEKRISALQSQIESLQILVAHKNEVAPLSAAYDVKNQLAANESIAKADGVNRPSQDPFSISGGVLNTKI